MLAAMWAADAPEHLPEDESAREGAASGTCSGDDHGTSSPELFSTPVAHWIIDALLVLAAAAVFRWALIFGAALQPDLIATPGEVIDDAYWVEIGERQTR